MSVTVEVTATAVAAHAVGGEGVMKHTLDILTEGGKLRVPLSATVYTDSAYSELAAASRALPRGVQLATSAAATSTNGRRLSK